jgi:hypothetical protein
VQSAIDGVYENELWAFDAYFASVCSMQYHPGAGTKEHRRLTIDECKDVAMQMLEARRGVVLIHSDRGN